MFNYNDEVIFYLKDSINMAKSLNSDKVSVYHLFLSILKNSENIKKIYEINIDEISKTKKKIKNKNLSYSKDIKIILQNCESYIKKYDIDMIDENILVRNILEYNDEMVTKFLNNYNINQNLILDTLEEKSITNNPVLESIGVNFNDMSYKLEDVYEREKELNEVIEILARKKKNNPLIIGKPGVGKTALVELLAKRINEGKVPNFLSNKKIIYLPISSVLAGTKYRGEFEEKLENILKYLETNKDYILFIDEIHTLIKAGASEGSIDAANIFKPALARSSICVIGATTNEEYENVFKKDKALERRFDVVEINEPNKMQTKNILMNIKKDYENFHNVIINEKIIDKILEASSNILPTRNEPDRSIDLLDRVCAKVRVSKSKNNKLKLYKEEKIKCIKNKEYDEAIKYYKKEKNFKESLCYEIKESDIKDLLKNNLINEKRNIGFKIKA